MSYFSVEMIKEEILQNYPVVRFFYLGFILYFTPNMLQKKVEQERKNKSFSEYKTRKKCIQYFIVFLMVFSHSFNHKNYETKNEQ